MRKTFSKQRQFDCRDEMIPTLRALQEIYIQPTLRDQIFELVTADVNAKSRENIGREGFTYWTILVLAAVKFGGNYDYDK